MAAESINAFHVLGTSYNLAPVEIREHCAVPLREFGPIARRLAQQPGVQEAVILSTGIRSEFYICGRGPEIAPTLDSFWQQTFQVESSIFRPFLSKGRIQS